MRTREMNELRRYMRRPPNSSILSTTDAARQRLAHRRPSPDHHHHHEGNRQDEMIRKFHRTATTTTENYFISLHLFSSSFSKCQKLVCRCKMQRYIQSYIDSLSLCVCVCMSACLPASHVNEINPQARATTPTSPRLFFLFLVFGFPSLSAGLIRFTLFKPPHRFFSSYSRLEYIGYIYTVGHM